MLQIFIIMIMGFYICGETAALQEEDIQKCEPGYWAETLRNGSMPARHQCRLCSRCPPGQRKRASCTETSDVTCEACRRGTYSHGWNTRAQCLPCMRCGPHRQKDVCTPTRNTVCKAKCNTGYYFDQQSNGCERCSLCSPGSNRQRVFECTQQDGGDPLRRCAEQTLYRVRSAPPIDGRRDEYPMPPEFHGYADDVRVVKGLYESSTFPTPMSSTRTRDRLATAETFGENYGVDLPTISMRLHGKITKQAGSNHLEDVDGDRLQMISSESPAPEQLSMSTETSSTSDREEQTAAVPLSTILIVLGIIAASGVISFVTTAVTCHCLIRRGLVKGGNSTVGYTRGRLPANGWIAVSQSTSVSVTLASKASSQSLATDFI